MAVKKLTDVTLKNLKPQDRPYKISDGTIGGLYVAVYPTGKKVFRLAFKFQGRAQLLTIGSYPEFTLSDVRSAALKSKRRIAQGQNPAELKKQAKIQASAEISTFRLIADEWASKRRPEWSEVHWTDTQQKLAAHILPRLGDIPLAEVVKADIKAILDTLHAQGKFATLKKVRSIISQIFQFAIDLEVPGVVSDWTYQLRRQYSNPPVKNRAALTAPKDVAALLKAIDGYKSISPITAMAIQFSALTFCRPGEIRAAEWAEIDLDEKLWRIPPEKMKGRQAHLVPLATQTMALLEELKPFTSHSKYLFPSTRSPQRPMSEATITAALRRMDFSKDEMCAHGFRGMASTLLNEKGYNRDWIERQLAHSPKDKVRAAYNHTDFLEDRRRMMQWWADYLEILSGEVK